jgi:hypothetical protein
MTACSDEKPTNNANSDDVTNETLDPQQRESSVNLYSDVVNSMGKIGAVKLTNFQPQNPPTFEGYRAVEYYRVPGKIDVYKVYIYNNNANPAMFSAQSECTKSWHSGGNGGEDVGCYSLGNTCDVELKNGEFIVICCDDQVPSA